MVKTEKNHQKCLFLTVFLIFFNLGSILAHQTSLSLFSGWWRIFWHPWVPWRRLNSYTLIHLINPQDGINDFINEKSLVSHTIFTIWSKISVSENCSSFNQSQYSSTWIWKLELQSWLKSKIAVSGELLCLMCKQF